MMTMTMTTIIVGVVPNGTIMNPSERGLGGRAATNTGNDGDNYNWDDLLAQLPSDGLTTSQTTQ